jgi:hypothetical protein
MDRARQRPPTAARRGRVRSLPFLVGIQSEKFDAPRFRNLNGGFNEFLRPVWRSLSVGFTP